MFLPHSLTPTQARPRATHLVPKYMVGPENKSSSPSLHSDFLHHLTPPHHPGSCCTLFPSRGTKDQKRAGNPHPLNGGRSRKEEQQGLITLEPRSKQTAYQAELGFFWGCWGDPVRSLDIWRLRERSPTSGRERALYTGLP